MESTAYAIDNFSFSFEHSDENHCNAKIAISLPFVEALYKKTLLQQREQFRTEGFARGSTPLTYIEYTCKNCIIDHLKEFLLNFCILDTLCQKIIEQKIVVAGEPTLTHVAIDPVQTSEFTFSFLHINSSIRNEWKKYFFKTPTRKNYKDIDRQVVSFLEQEKTNTQALASHVPVVQPADWILFALTIIDEESGEPLHNYESLHWLKIGREETDKDAQELFLNRTLNERFSTKNDYLQRYFSRALDTRYLFQITIKRHVPHESFSTEYFKRHFRIKSCKELHRTLIEVFSFRNDISQRREIVEATFKTLFKQNVIAIPAELIRRQEQIVLSAVRRSPDYHVYRSQLKDFKKKVTLLAEKQLREALIIDHICHQENITIDHNDVIGYLNLLQRPRTKEFVHFTLPYTQLNGQEQPLPAGIVNQACLREKTLNYIIRQLRKN